MRIIKSYTKKGVQFSFLELAHKYLIKCERGPLELTYKFRKGPGLESSDELEKFAENHVFEKASIQLAQCETDRSKMIEGYFKDQFDFEEII